MDNTAGGGKGGGDGSSDESGGRDGGGDGKGSSDEGGGDEGSEAERMVIDNVCLSVKPPDGIIPWSTTRSVAVAAVGGPVSNEG